MSIGVLLGGCGYYDGTDAHEAVFTLLAIESAGERAILIAPDIDQDRVVDHLTGDEVSERRNVMRESARLARLPIHSLADTRPEDLEALIIPGGYGPVVNFSTGFARVGERRRLRGDVETFLGRCLAARLPIGCVSLGEIPLRTTLGEDLTVPESPRSATALAVDREKAIVHTPGSTAFTRLADVKAGIDAMVAGVLSLVQERRRQAAPAARNAPDPS
ncbi:MAG: hypothetical protein DMF51_13930 [Acidobacteria bacterium]|nr:MAG: hypothetical protein DMF51_13930 [Acidobacteriota bacterium]